MFKKVLIAIAPEGFAGKTIPHTITKANLANQPEFVEQGIKVGDTVQIIEPVVDPALVGESAASKTKPSDPPEEKAVKAKTKDEGGEISNEKGNPKRAKEIADAQSVEVVFENDKGEFFTSENLARLSVGNDKAKLIIHSF